MSRRNVGTADRWVSGALALLVLSRLGRRHGVASKMLGVTAGVVYARKALTGRSSFYRALGINSRPLGEGGGIEIETSITINRPKDEIFEFWRDVTNLPLVMRHIESVEPTEYGRTRWKAKGPRGIPAEWEAQAINMRPGEYLAWDSMPGSRVENAGSVHFYDAGDKGTEVLLRMRYLPYGSTPGVAIGKLLNPITEAEVAEDLRRLKHMMETGVDIDVDGQPTGPRSKREVSR